MSSKSRGKSSRGDSKDGNPAVPNANLNADFRADAVTDSGAGPKTAGNLQGKQSVIQVGPEVVEQGLFSPHGSRRRPSQPSRSSRSAATPPLKTKLNEVAPRMPPTDSVAAGTTSKAVSRGVPSGFTADLSVAPVLPRQESPQGAKRRASRSVSRASEEKPLVLDSVSSMAQTLPRQESPQGASRSVGRAFEGKPLVLKSVVRKGLLRRIVPAKIFRQNPQKKDKKEENNSLQEFRDGGKAQVHMSRGHWGPRRESVGIRSGRGTHPSTERTDTRSEPNALSSGNSKAFLDFERIPKNDDELSQFAEAIRGGVENPKLEDIILRLKKIARRLTFGTIGHIEPKTEWEVGAVRLDGILDQLGIFDMRVREAFLTTPRDLFTPVHHRNIAYHNQPIPIGYAQTMMAPHITARALVALNVARHHEVLEIGAGTGYSTALLARLCKRVSSLERIEPLVQQAQVFWKHLSLNNIFVKLGDGSIGWPSQAPFDRIFCQAAVERVPHVLLDQLLDGGVLVIPVGEPDLAGQVLVAIRRKGRRFEKMEIGTGQFGPLVDGPIWTKKVANPYDPDIMVSEPDLLSGHHGVPAAMNLRQPTDT